MASLARMDPLDRLEATATTADADETAEDTQHWVPMSTPSLRRLQSTHALSLVVASSQARSAALMQRFEAPLDPGANPHPLASHSPLTHSAHPQRSPSPSLSPSPLTLTLALALTLVLTLTLALTLTLNTWDAAAVKVRGQAPKGGRQVGPIRAPGG